jgi:GNAT superfamily N-acetyltransferase
MDTPRIQTLDPATLQVVVDPEVTAALLDELVALWVRVTNAGGAVGFVKPTSAAAVRPVAEKALARVAAGCDTLVALRAPEGPIVAWCTLARSDSGLRQHWRTLVRVMVDPGCQSAGVGSALLRAVHHVARHRLGIEGLLLQVRGGTGTDRFYARHGYETVGRIPGAIRLDDCAGSCEDRDEVVMWRRLAGE